MIWKITLVTLVCMVTYTFEMVFGLAGTIIMLFILGMVFDDLKVLVIYSTLPQIMVAVIGLWRSHNTVKWKELFNMLAFAILGSFIGMVLFYKVSSETFRTLLASAIILFGSYLVISPKVITMPRWLQHTLDFFAGISQQLFGISGPIAMTRILSSHRDKTVVRNYAFAFFLSLNVYRFGSYIVHDLTATVPKITQEVMYLMLFSAPFLLVTFWFAHHLHFKINDELFRKVVPWAILLGGLVLLLDPFR
jgi:uncharacterized membrane protein YfcA